MQQSFDATLDEHNKNMQEKDRGKQVQFACKYMVEEGEHKSWCAKDRDIHFSITYNTPLREERLINISAWMEN